jgi:hypothetical protein
MVKRKQREASYSCGRGTIHWCERTIALAQLSQLTPIIAVFSGHGPL